MGDTSICMYIGRELQVTDPHIIHIHEEVRGPISGVARDSFSFPPHCEQKIWAGRNHEPEVSDGCGLYKAYASDLRLSPLASISSTPQPLGPMISLASSSPPTLVP